MDNLIPCCRHCGCKSGERSGHDDTCSLGCNDEQQKQGEDVEMSTFNPMSHGHDIRPFMVVRLEDASGTSGTGPVAIGAVFPDGTTVVQWQTRARSVVIFKSYVDALYTHGHGHKTGFVFDADPGRIHFSDGTAIEFTTSNGGTS